MENLTTYIEYDPLDNIAVVNPTEVNFQAWRNRVAYLGKAGAFGDFTANMDVIMTYADRPSNGAFLSLINVLDDLDPYVPIIVVEFRQGGSGEPLIRVKSIDEENGYVSDFVTIALGTRYYVTITRAGTTVTVDVYSDTTRNTLVGTAQIQTTSAWIFSHLYVCNNPDDAAPLHQDLNIQNVDLTIVDVTGTLSVDAYQSSIPVGATVTFDLGGVQQVYTTPFSTILPAGTYTLTAIYGTEEMTRDATVNTGETTIVIFVFTGEPPPSTEGDLEVTVLGVQPTTQVKVTATSV